MSLLAIWAGAKRLLGIEPSWDAVATRIRQYSLGDILNTVGRIDALLRNEGSTESDVQLRICAGLFAAEAVTVARRLELMRYRDSRDSDLRPAQYVLFGHRPLATLLQVAAYECTPTYSKMPEGESLAPLGEALLVINDLIEASRGRGKETGTDEGRRDLIYFLSMMAPEPGNEPTVHLAARAVDLFLLDKPVLHSHPDYVNLPALFQEASGLDVEAYGLALAFFLGTLYGIDRENVSRSSVAFRAEQFQGSGLRFTSSQIDALFALGGKRIGEFDQLMRETYEPGWVRPYFHLPLEQSPLIRFEEAALCGSVHLLERRLTMGLYHVLLNARPGDENARARARFQQYVGAVFEDYVLRLFSRIASRQNARRKGTNRKSSPAWVFTETQLQDCLGLPQHRRPPVCDAIFMSRNTLFLIESKARLFSVAARAAVKPEEFFERLEQIVVEAGRQLDSTLSLVGAGSFRSIGIDPRKISYVFPVIASLQDVQMNPLLKEWLRGLLSAEDLLKASEVGGMVVRDLELLGAGDLEWLEVLVEKGGQTAENLFQRKHADPLDRSHSFWNWIAVRRIAPLVGGRVHLDYHAAIFDQLTTDALGFFRTHAGNG